MRVNWAHFKTGGALSAVGHVSIIVVAQFGLPFLFTSPEVTATIIPVEVVSIDDVTRPPAAATPEPDPEPTRTASPQPPPKPPAPSRSFDNILKDLAADEKPVKTVERARQPETVRDKGKEAPQQSQIAERATIAELDLLRQLIRRQVGQCWNPPVGAQNAEDLIVTVLIRLDPQGVVREATVVDAPLMGLDRYFQAAAEAARRAVLNAKCQPFELPADKYEIWKEIRFNFDPSKMLS